MLLMTDVSKTYPSGSVALRDVNIHIQPGEFVFVVGPSGAGKSTFIKMLFREVIPTTGNIYVNGVDLLELKEKEIPYLRRQLGIIFQDYRLLPDRTVYDNVAFAMQVIETPYRKIKRRVMSVLDLVGLRKRANSYPTELSGGEQQRVAIARAIVNDPLLVIADEILHGNAGVVGAQHDDHTAGLHLGHSFRDGVAAAVLFKGNDALGQGRVGANALFCAELLQAA